MAFEVCVNQERFSLCTESIVDDLSSERVSAEEIETLAQMFAERFLALGTKTVLVQGLSNTFLLSLALGAWRVGVTLAFIREDAFLPYFEKSIAQLHSPLHFFYDLSQKEVFVNDGGRVCQVEQWFEDSPSDDLPFEPFVWSDTDVALIFFTSGSTGLPKGVCHSLPSLFRSARAFQKHYQICASDRIVCFAELHTNTGLRTLALPLLSAHDVLFVRNHERTKLHALLELQSAKFLICGPYLVKALLHFSESRKDFLPPDLKILSFGAYLPPQWVEAFFLRYGISVLNFYGLTETFGFALANAELSTADVLPAPCEGVSHHLLPAEGEANLFFLQIQSPNLLLGYLGEPLCKREVFDTGDLVSKTEQGDLKFLGRASGATKTKNGEWVFPFQLEAWLQQQPEVQDALVKVNALLEEAPLFSVFIKTVSPFEALKKSLSEKILTFFGADYAAIDWQQAEIARSVEGKLNSISEFPVYA